MSIHRYLLLAFTALLTYLVSSLLGASENNIATIHDGRPYILNFTAGTFLKDAHRTLTVLGYEQISNKDAKTTYRNSARRIEIEINSNSEQRIIKIAYFDKNEFTENDILIRGKNFGKLGKENLVCRAAMPYSMDCFYKINNEQGKYNLIGVFQKGGVQYVLEGTPKFTVVTGFRPVISNQENEMKSELKNIKE